MHALITERSIEISSFHAEFTTGIVQSGGRLFSDKAPGVAFASLPGIFLASQFNSRGSSSNRDEATWLIDPALAGVVGVGPYTVIGFIICRRVLSRYGPPFRAWMWSAACFLAPPCSLFSGCLLSHSLTVTCLWLAIYWRIRGLETGGFLYLVLSGFAAGYSVSCEYSAAICSVATVLLVKPVRRGLLGWCLGFLAGLIPICVNLYAIYGTVWVIPYSGNDLYPHMAAGIAGVTFIPNLEVAAHLLFSPVKGLFVWNVALLFCWLRLPQAIGAFRHLRIVCYLLFCIHVAVISSYGYPAAGNWISSRLLAPAVPFLILLGVCVGSGNTGTRSERAVLCLAIVQAFPVAVLGGDVISESAWWEPAARWMAVFRDGSLSADSLRVLCAWTSCVITIAYGALSWNGERMCCVLLRKRAGDRGRGFAKH